MKQSWKRNEYGMWSLHCGEFRIVVENDDRKGWGKYWMASINTVIFSGRRWDTAEEAKLESVKLFKEKFAKAIEELS